MEYNEALKELYSLDVKKWTLGLDRIEELLKKLGSPERKLRCIHVTGTNGKGSVCAMLHSILMNAGYKVGLYTSPHLKKFNERIRINNNLIVDKELVGYYSKVKKYISAQSFFEITTAMAFLYFAEKDVDFVVLEVGLGGRLDATNVVTPLVSIITNVGLEHTQFLGNSIEQIANEKSGIIKEKVPIITGAEDIALDAIKKIAHGKNAKLTIVKKNTIKLTKLKTNNSKNKKNKIIEKAHNCSFDYNGYKNLILGLNGKFQAHNATIALEAIKVLQNNYKIKLNEKNIIDGLRNVQWPGRLQFIEKNVLIDCAHNPHGFRILVEELETFNYGRLIAVLGFSKDKDIHSMAEIIGSLASKIILTKSSNERAAEPQLIKKHFNKQVAIIKNPQKALKYAKKIARKNDLILIAGSIFLVGELI